MSGVIERRGRTAIRFSGIPLPQMPRATREAQHLAIMDAVRYWRAKYGPEHFKVSAYSKYGGQEADVYDTPVKGSSRFKKGGGARAPLVSPRRRPTSGNLRRSFLTGSMVMKPAGSGSSLKVTASWPSLPQYVYIDKHGTGRAQGPRKYLELTVMTDEEGADLARVFNERFQYHLDQMAKGE